jgi:hypothetical protein
MRPQRTTAEIIAKLRAQADASRLRRARAANTDNKLVRQLIDAG